ncbi:hypothetical protein D9613_002660 [Agrocybe pediades]|uniref:Uncharacterized protein n=1 Tax=Agrocybe pediades TaxID=84607 RepID=A0A8H4VLW5_9AGAR|nr:hypothetical protein D9613_002660 [Agrocybe pediades]
MAKSTAQSWALFKAIRVMVFSFAMICSMGFAAIYAVLLLRGWSSYNGQQRCVVIISLVVYAISSLLLYLMLILRFRVWLDGVRIVLLLFCQVGGTVTFAIFRPNLPCSNLGSVSTCDTVETIVTYGGWGLAGLSIMSYVPVPPPRPNPEAVLALKLSNDFTPYQKEKQGKRLSDSSMGSSTSSYSQSSFVASRPPTTPSTMAFASRTPSMVSTRPLYNNDNYYRSAPSPGPAQGMTYNIPPRMRALQLPTMAARAPSIASSGSPRMAPYGQQQYRSATPGAESVRSMAPSTVSNLNIRASTRQRYYNSNGIPAPVPVLPQSQYMMPSTMMAGEAISRQGTPMSMISNQSGSSYYPPRQQQQPQRSPSAAGYLSPPGLAYSHPGQFPHPPGVSSPYTRNMVAGAPSRVTSPSPLGQMQTIAEDGHFQTPEAVMRGPMNGMAMPTREALTARTPSPSPHPQLEIKSRSPSPHASPSALQTGLPANNLVAQGQQPQTQPQQMPQKKRYQLQDRPMRQQKLREETEQQPQYSPPSRRSSVSSVPRSPSPQHEFFSPSSELPLPTTPMSAVLPAHPTLPPRTASPSTNSSPPTSGYGYPRYSPESSPTLRLNDRPLPNEMAIRAQEDHVELDVTGFWRQNSPRPLRLVGKRA